MPAREALQEIGIELNHFLLGTYAFVQLGS